MANTIDVAFIKQFESDVHMAYQRMGSKLRNTVRTVGNVAGNVVRFQTIGTGTAMTNLKEEDATALIARCFAPFTCLMFAATRARCSKPSLFQSLRLFLSCLLAFHRMATTSTICT